MEKHFRTKSNKPIKSKEKRPMTIKTKKFTAKYRVSAKNIGGLAMPEACPRCFKRDVLHKIPMAFPGIFSTIDSHVKEVVHAVFNQTGSLPTWLSNRIGNVTGLIPAPHWTKFNYTDEDLGITVTGVADDIYLSKVNGIEFITIVDYKTAARTNDKLIPIYEAQLNGYSLISEKIALPPVKNLFLIYNPPTHFEDRSEHNMESGFSMNFGAEIVEIANRPYAIFKPFVEKAVSILEDPHPSMAKDCKTCKAYDALVSAYAPQVELSEAV